jgi:riboflavin-specific deaminase-like protein
VTEPARFTRLTPAPADGLTARDVAHAVAPEPRPDRPFVALNMIATADGRVAIAGRTGPIANRADYELFHQLRTRVDAVMVGAGTVRAEGYGRLVPSPALRAQREADGLAPDPLAVLVSRSLDVPGNVGLLADPHNRVVVVTPAQHGELPARAADVSYVREADLGVALQRLGAEYGVRSILCEGGPRLNAHLVPARLVDELHLVIAPKLAAGQLPLTILTGPVLDPPLEMTLVSVHESGGYLFCRYAIG